MNLQIKKNLDLLFMFFLVLGIVLIRPVIAGAKETEYPTKPIKLIVAFAPGGATDMTARALAKGAEKYLGKPIVVENKPGGGGTVGPSLLAKEKPDGYTLGTLAGGAATWSPLILKLSYDVMKDFTFIMQYGTYMMFVSARADASFNTAQELIEYSRKNPNLTFGTSGSNQISDVVQLVVAKKAGISWKAIGFDGNIPAITALLGGHVSFIAATQDQITYVKSGHIKPLVTYCDSRIPYLPDIPTWRELGYDVGAESAFGIVGPRGIPISIVEKLVNAFKKATESQEYQSLMNSLYTPMIYRGPEEFARTTEEYLKRYHKMLKEVGVPTVRD